MKEPIKFDATEGRDFASTLRLRVDTYFKEKNISKHANGLMIFKSLFHSFFWVGSYFLLVLGGFSTPVNYVLYAVLGLFTAMAAVNIGHDAIHGAYSGKPWVNRLLSHTFNINGASAYMWKLMHNSAHHTYTNVDGYDEDIESVPILRLSPTQRLRKEHRFQHWYAWGIYPLATLSWVFIKDYVKFFKNEVGNFNNYKHPTREYFLLFFYKICYYTIFIAVPFYVLEQAWYHTLLGFLILHFVEGFTLAIIFMLAHIVEKTHFPIPEEGKLSRNWYAHQLYTTANFASESWLAAFTTGGLNQQVEHHLFPNICSVHYPKLRNIVKQTAEEFGYPYLEEPSFWSAISSHRKFLKEIGRIENYVPKAA